jgi:hypothetical protein
MNKYILIVLFTSLLSNVIQAQEQDFIEVKDAIIDTTLKLYPNTPFDGAYYIKNKNYVIYQKDVNSRIVLNVDIKSFRFPKHFDNTQFALDKNGIYFDGDFIKTDTTGFEIIAQTQNLDDSNKRDLIWKTNAKLFRNKEEILGDFDIKSFKSAGYSSDNYFKDKNYIYYHLKKIVGSDPASASKSLEGGVIYDKNYVYINGEIGLHNGDTLFSVNDILMKTSKEVLTLKHHSVLPDIDVKTLRSLSRYYSVDKNFVYFQDKKTQILPKDFKNIKVWDEKGISYITDGKNVYFGADILKPDLDAKTFGVLTSSEYLFDKNGIYEVQWNKEENKLINKKFPFVYSKYVTEKNFFKGYTSKYIIYENQAYDIYNKKLHTDLSEKQIELVKTTNLNFVNDEIIEVRMFENSVYEARNKIYFGKKGTIADPATFQSLSGYYIDKNYVYTGYGLTPIKGIDVQTVTKPSYGFLADKDYIYSGNYRIIKNKNVELLAVFIGYRPGCGLDTTPSSNYYLFKNDEGYWFVSLSDVVKINNLGNKLIKKQGNIEPLYTIRTIDGIPVDESKIYNSAEVDVKPEFRGGIGKQSKFLKKNFKGPEDEGETLKGRIYMSFVVEKDGRLTDIKVLRDYGYGSGKEALRVIKKMPKWIPAKSQGTPVRYLTSLVITVPTVSL